MLRTIQKLIDDYGKNLENKQDGIDGLIHRKPLFCIDCRHYKNCKGRHWDVCAIKNITLKEIGTG
jgi:hypothetical protein